MTQEAPDPCLVGQSGNEPERTASAKRTDGHSMLGSAGWQWKAQRPDTRLVPQSSNPHVWRLQRAPV